MPDAATPGEQHLGLVDFKYPYFSRFALMKRWNEDNIPLEQLDDGGRLHTSEWATKFIALALSGAIVGASQAVA